MQRLVFEATWDRTISQKDREEIEQIFQNEVVNVDTGITFTTVWVAENHKKECLVTTIVHNKTEQHVIFENTILECWEDDTLLADHTFTFSGLQVPPKTSMPWTFIFPAGSFVISDSTVHAQLKLKNEK